MNVHIVAACAPACARAKIYSSSFYFPDVICKPRDCTILQQLEGLRSHEILDDISCHLHNQGKLIYDLVIDNCLVPSADTVFRDHTAFENNLQSGSLTWKCILFYTFRVVQDQCSGGILISENLYTLLVLKICVENIYNH